jgi:hypothetical protein
MNYLTVYKDTEVTNNEMLEALKSLGYVEIENEPLYIRLENPQSKLHLVMPNDPLSEYIKKYYTAKFSYQLEMFEIIKHRDDLVKGILKERTKKKRALKKQQQAA